MSKAEKAARDWIATECPEESALMEAQGIAIVNPERERDFIRGVQWLREQIEKSPLIKQAETDEIHPWTIADALKEIIEGES